MNQFFSILGIILIWVISFVEPSGWATLFHLIEKVNFVIIAASLLYFITKPSRRLCISQLFFVFILIFLVFVPYIVSSTWQGASYMIAFLTTYLASQFKVTAKTIKYSSLAIAFLGIFILLIYVRGSILSGWNDNAISMVGLFSYIYFTIFLISKRDTGQFWAWNIITVIYLQLLFQTDCRSGMLFSVLAVVAIYFSKSTKKIFRKKRYTLLLLNIPLIVSLICILISNTSLYSELNSWSIHNFDKSIFNDRDEIWNYALETLSKSSYIGTGEFMTNYHNSGVAAIAVFGVIGYYIWIKLLRRLIDKLLPYLNDDIIFGCVLAFSLIFVQQSVDLGFISACPNLLPYMILGVGLGRVYYIESRLRLYSGRF